MSTKRNYESVKPGNFWSPQASEKNNFAYDPKNDKDNVIEGYYVGIKTDQGSHNKSVYEILEILSDGREGVKYSLWEDTVLGDLMSGVPMGSFVKIKYNGRKHYKGQPTNVPWTKTNSYHMWDVMIDKNAVPYKVKAPDTNDNITEGANVPSNGSRGIESAPAQPLGTEDDLPF